MPKTKKPKPLTYYADLKAEIDKLTPEQLAMPVFWCGEDRGGDVYSVSIVEEDQVNPSGDGMEPVSVVRKYLIEDEGLTPEEADKEIDDEGICCVKGQPLLMVDL